MDGRRGFYIGYLESESYEETCRKRKMTLCERDGNETHVL
jgi:hypothetical protein